MFSTLACSLDDEWFGLGEDDETRFQSEKIFSAILNEIPERNDQDGADGTANIDNTTPEFRKEQVRKFADAFNTGGCHGILRAGPQLFHADCVLQDPNLGVHSGDWTSICAYWNSIMEAYADLHLELEQINMVNENIVTSKWRLTGRHIKSSFGIPASNKSIAMSGTQSTHFDRKRCTKFRFSGAALICCNSLWALLEGHYQTWHQACGKWYQG